MTTVVVIAEPPVAGEVLPDLHPTPLSEDEAATLYRAMLVDVCSTVQRGAGTLLVNYPRPERMPSDLDAETELRDLLDDELPSPDEARYEVQAGETYAGRVGNALTHLLESEQEETVAVVEPTAPLLRRDHLGKAMMQLRSSEVVLGPSTDGGVYFAGFDDPVDFEDAYATPAVETLTDRGLDADLDVDFLPVLPRIERPSDLAIAVPLIRSRIRAERIAPPHTGALVEEWGLRIDSEGELSRRSDSS